MSFLFWNPKRFGFRCSSFQYKLMLVLSSSSPLHLHFILCFTEVERSNHLLVGHFFQLVHQLLNSLLMSPHCASKPRKSLEDVRGLHVLPHSPFTVEKVTQHADFRSNYKTLEVESNQRLLMQ